MRDKVELRVGGYTIENFLAYSIEANIYTADDAFSIEMVQPEIEIAEGARCEMWVNNHLELTGIIDRIDEMYDKSGRQMRIEGRDLCGLLVDSCCEEFITIQGMTLKTLAARLLKNVPFINRKEIVYQENIRGHLKKKKGKGSSTFLGALDGASPQAFAQIEPGQTIFEVLRIYCMSRGMMFFTMPDGTFVFGKPKEGGEPLFSIVMSKSDPGSNMAVVGRRVRDISRRYSKIKVMGQQQGLDIFGTSGAHQMNTLATVTDATFPFYKPFVAVDNNDARSPKLHAQMLMEQQKAQGFCLEYVIPGHSQNGRNWEINELCRVRDDVLKPAIDTDYLVYGRTFEMDKKRGVLTTVRLGFPGAVL